MKERPILFKPEMVRAILEGRKTMTRRVIKPQPECSPDSAMRWESSGKWQWRLMGGLEPAQAPQFACPYGNYDDRLWVRESIRKQDDVMVYCADGTTVSQDGLVLPSIGEKPVIPSIHMPRWACRLVLELTAVRVERVQSISGADALAEGIQATSKYGKDADVSDFQELWESINGPSSWDANPWVWVLEFKQNKESAHGRI